MKKLGGQEYKKNVSDPIQVWVTHRPAEVFIYGRSHKNVIHAFLFKVLNKNIAYDKQAQASFVTFSCKKPYWYMQQTQRKI